MTKQIVLTSLEELGQFAGLIVADELVSDERALVPRPPEPAAALDLDALVETIRRSALELQALSTADAFARKQAEEALAMYRRVTTEACHIQRIAGEAQVVARQASAFAACAFSLECQEGAAQLAEVAVMVANEARGRLPSITTEADALAVREDVSRLLAEERAKEGTARLKADEREREARLSEGIVEAEASPRAGNFDEARRTLGYLAKDHPNNPTLASCMDKVRRQEWAVKTFTAERGLRGARRHRRDPRGGQLEVVSAIGLPRWHAGRHFSRVALKGARPLK